MSRNRAEMGVGFLVAVVAFGIAAATPLRLRAIALMGLAGYGCLLMGRSVGREMEEPV